MDPKMTRKTRKRLEALPAEMRRLRTAKCAPPLPWQREQSKWSRQDAVMSDSPAKFITFWAPGSPLKLFLKHDIGHDLGERKKERLARLPRLARSRTRPSTTTTRPVRLATRPCELLATNNLAGPRALRQVSAHQNEG